MRLIIFLDFTMDINSNSKLEYKDIKSSLSKLNSRQLYILVYKIHLNRIDIVVNNNLDYLINKIQALEWNARELNNYIEQCISLVIEDRYIGWLEKDLRAAIWFDKYWSRHRCRMGIEEFSLYANFETDFLKSFDASRLLNKQETIYELEKTKINRLLPKNTFRDATPENYPKPRPVRSMNDNSRQNKIKIDFIISAKKRYSLDSASKKDLKWLDNNNEQQIDWAINYLEALDLLLRPHLFIANDSKDCYDQVCASIDAFSILRNNLKRNNEIVTLSQKGFIDRMKNAWYQVISRSKSPKKSLDKPPLDKTYQKKLQKLCKNYGVDAPTYLKGLIDDELKKL